MSSVQPNLVWQYKYDKLLTLWQLKVSSLHNLLYIKYLSHIHIKLIFKKLKNQKQKKKRKLTKKLLLVKNYTRTGKEVNKLTSMSMFLKRLQY